MHSHRKIPQSPGLTKESSLKTLVENRTVFTLEKCELNLFETYEESYLVPLKFSDFVVTSMLRGKKVMHLHETPEFEYLPGQTVIVPSNVEMKIDFPEATSNNPTQCTAMAIDRNKIDDTLDFLNDKYPKGDKNFWQLDYNNYFFYNNEEMAHTINKLIHVSMSNDITKDVRADLTLQELIIHIIQSQTLTSATNDLNLKVGGSMGEVIRYIGNHLSHQVTLKELTEIACMSPASFYRSFKREFGVNPVEYITSERIKMAKNMLKNSDMQVSQVCFEAGFEDPNYFIRVFKKVEGLTPVQYRKCFHQGEN